MGEEDGSKPLVKSKRRGLAIEPGDQQAIDQAMGAEKGLKGGGGHHRRQHEGYGEQDLPQFFGKEAITGEDIGAR